TYYCAHLGEHAAVMADYQFVVNPAYNRDRGPVSLFGLRLHAEF
ncbi:MAG TPA: carbohydrate porin, partial [Burkholderiaceae bacterium]|nr:carbohydrate porin [Burkholderiaceae bacterium]